MKKLGLVGGTGPESTLVYYHDLVYGVQQCLGRQCFPPMSIESVDVYRALDMCAKKQDDEYVEYFSAAIANLAAAGAQFAAISANTPHMVFDAIQKRSPLPLVSIVEAAVEAAARRGYKRLGLLGTLYTMQASFYVDAFAAHGMTLLRPTEAEMAWLGGKISEELEQGVKNVATLARLQQIISRMQQEAGIEAVVLGCTELPLLLNDSVSPVPCLDTMQVHIKKLVELIVADELQDANVK